MPIWTEAEQARLRQAQYLLALMEKGAAQARKQLKLGFASIEIDLEFLNQSIKKLNELAKADREDVQ